MTSPNKSVDGKGKPTQDGERPSGGGACGVGEGPSRAERRLPDDVALPWSCGFELEPNG